MLVEICVDSITSAVTAEAAGAGRLELCADATVGGITPTTALLEAVTRRVRVPVFAMVRPRAGDFVYDDDEIELMRREAILLRDAGAAGIVSGALRGDGSIDESTTQTLIDVARPLPFTFHRAFDLVRDQTASLDALLSLGADRVLTSGGASSALAGADRIASLVRQAAGRLIVMAGGSIRAPHAAELVRRTGVRELHARPTRRRESPMRFRNPGVIIAKREPPDDQGGEEVDPSSVRALVTAVP